MNTSESQPGSDRWRRHRAARVVAHHARDAAELTELLDMFGLTAAEGRYPPAPRAGTAPVAIPAPALPAEEQRRLASLLLASFAREVLC